MHKKLEAELMSLAHKILQLKDKNDVIKLRDNAKDVYEKLSVLAFVDNYFLTTVNPTENKTELLEKLAKAETKKTVTTKQEVTKTEKIAKTTKVEKVEKPTDNTEIRNLLEGLDANTKEKLQADANEIFNAITEKKPVESNQKTAKTATKPNDSLANNDEFKDSIPADVAANLFEKATNLERRFKEKTATPKTEVKQEKPKENVAVKVTQKQQYVKPKEQKKSLNDKLFKNKLQIGLNDRIAFVKHLFNYSQEDFNRVLSQLNTFQSESDAKNFINSQVKPDYDWSDKETYVTRLFDLIERKFS